MRAFLFVSHRNFRSEVELFSHFAQFHLEKDPIAKQGGEFRFESKTHPDESSGRQTGVQQPKRSYEFRNNSSHPADSRVAGSSADVGLQQFVGIRSERACRPAARHFGHTRAARADLATVRAPDDQRFETINNRGFGEIVMKIAKKIVMLLVLLGTIVTAVSGCRTAHGFGEDMEDAGQHIQRNVN